MPTYYINCPERQLSFIHRVQTTAAKLRGAYLDICCDIEFVLVDMTCVCLVKDRVDREKTKLTLMAGLMMRKKISLASEALRKYNCTYYNKYKDCFEKLKELLSWRNKFAHSKIDGYEDDPSVNFLKFEYIENGKMQNKREEVMPLFEKLKEYAAAIYKIGSELIPILYAEQHFADLDSKANNGLSNK